MYILLIEVSFLQNLMKLQVKPTGQMVELGPTVNIRS